MRWRQWHGAHCPGDSRCFYGFRLSKSSAVSIAPRRPHSVAPAVAPTFQLAIAIGHKPSAAATLPMTAPPTAPTTAARVTRTVFRAVLIGLMREIPQLLPTILRLRHLDRLPLHGGRRISAAAFQGDDVIDDVAGARV